MGMNSRWTFRFIALIVFVLVFFGARLTHLYTDYLWFLETSYVTIFSTILVTKTVLFGAAALAAFLILWINTSVAYKISKSKIPRPIVRIGSIVLSLIIGSIAMSNWDTVLRMLNQVPFGILDPVFSKDISFFIFTLPLYELVLRVITIITVFSGIVAAVVYFSESLTKAAPKVTVDQYGNKTPDFSSLKKAAKPLLGGGKLHLSILGGIFFVLLGLNHFLNRYEILYSTRGAIYGAGFTDTTVSLPALTFLFFVALAVGLLIVVWMAISGSRPQLRNKHIVLGAIGLYVVVLLLGTIVIPGITQYFKVSPNEIEIEKPYIDRTIKYTRLAYGLDNVIEEDYPVEQNLTLADINANPETIQNIRLLDWRPLMKTYKQLQEIRLYYDFIDVDIDRYDVEGDYRQVMLSARELNVEQLPPQAQTWLNTHLVYTHGYGVTASPVNRVTKEGQPDFMVKDIPPQTKEESLEIERPEIYYGEHNNDFVIVRTTQQEFDYPKGDQNMYTTYEGKGGVPIGGFLSRLMMAIRFGDFKLLISSAMTDESKIMFYRNIQERITRITPFLSLDMDPYMVIADGHLYWIQDAYTVSNKYPYSEPTRGINYVRNSVKIIVNAYDGTIDYYIADPTDPIIQTWSRVFPKQFKSLEEMPETLKKHLRYPEGLFKIQADMYATYHMSDASVFYNKEDMWDIPNEIYGQGQQVQMDPYYVILKLPGWEKEEFTMMIPFTPRKKDNMIAWMAAKSDANYGELVLFKFPKDKLVYGPMQIEARIDQDSEISQQLTLWSQKGSSVTRGNVLVIPVERSLLYVEPLYIQADKSQMPELKRVIVSDGTAVVMEETFEEAMSVLLKETRSRPVAREKSDEEFTIQDAWDAYKDAISKVSDGDWSGFGLDMGKLGDVLEQLAS